MPAGIIRDRAVIIKYFIGIFFITIVLSYLVSFGAEANQCGISIF